MGESALDWWAKQTALVCAATFVVGWLFLGGLGPLVMIPLAGLCVFPVVNRIVDDPSRIMAAFHRLVDAVRRGIDGDGLDDPSPGVPTPGAPEPGAPITGIPAPGGPGCEAGLHSHLGAQPTTAPRVMDGAAANPVPGPEPVAPKTTTAPTGPAKGRSKNGGLSFDTSPPAAPTTPIVPATSRPAMGVDL